MTPESTDLTGLLTDVEFDVDIEVAAEVLRLERDLPSAEELDRWFEAPVRRAA